MAQATVPAGTLPALSDTVRRFVRDWGELADRWGTDRSVAEAHAIVFLASGPLDAAAVAAALNLRPEEAADALESLAAAGVVRVADRTGGLPRYERHGDLWDMFRAILEERRRREFEPAVAAVRDAVLRADSDPQCDDRTRRRLEEMQSFLRDAGDLYRQLSTMPGAETRRLLKMGSKIRRALGLD